jgi:alpha,alpha-trehalose phosphorylase
VVQSIIAAEVGYHELALRYFWDSVFVDLADLHSNTGDGVHVASAGGVWSALVFGFGGMRDFGSMLHFDPRLPDAWPSLTFRMAVHGTRLRVTVRHETITFAIEEGHAMTVDVRGQYVTVSKGEEVVVPLKNQGPRIAGSPDPAKFHGTLRADGTIITASLPPSVGDDDVVDAEPELPPAFPE